MFCWRVTREDVEGGNKQDWRFSKKENGKGQDFIKRFCKTSINSQEKKRVGWTAYDGGPPWP